MPRERAPAPAGPQIDWKNPDYDAIATGRVEQLKRIRERPEILPALKEYYQTHPADFISDWFWCYEPRNPEVGKPATIPMVLFPRQREFIDWLYEGWRERENGIAEKSRDMGVSWCCVGFGVWMILFYAGTVVGFGSRKEEYVDKLGDPKSLFWKARFAIDMLPVELQPKGWDVKAHAPFMRIQNPENGAVLVGEAGDNIGRGNRTSIYFVDESAFLERQEAVDAALSQTTNCRVDVSTPNGSGNLFYRRRHGGKVPVFVFDWRDDPRKDQAWYDAQVAKTDNPVLIAQEIDRDYSASVSDSWFDGQVVRAAMARGPADVPPSGGLRVGLDVARFGDDSNVLTFRRGRAVVKVVRWKKTDLMTTAGRAKAEIEAFGMPPEQIAVDTVGMGAGVADALRAWWPDRFNSKTNKNTRIVVDVDAGRRMDDGQNYNLRAFMARQVRDWLPTASLPRDHELESEMTSVRYFFRGGALLLESKQEAKKRGVKSPDGYDSLALTFAVPTIGKIERPAVTPYVPAVPGVM